ncbi:MAG: hypothetical protein IT353_06640 [Gemmatimonadaceae bacterium]|nr:hypothetical protein [Gemmatimonadaceae bacterium]
MVRTPSLGIIALALCAAACQHAPKVAVAPTPLPVSPSVALLADSTAASKAALELERLKMLTIYAPWAKQLRAVEDRIFATDLQLLRVPSEAALVAMDRVLRTLDQRQAGLTTEIDQLLVTYTTDAAPVQRAEEEMRQLLVRRIELRVQRSLYASR